MRRETVGRSRPTVGSPRRRRDADVPDGPDVEPGPGPVVAVLDVHEAVVVGVQREEVGRAVGEAEPEHDVGVAGRPLGDPDLDDVAVLAAFAGLVHLAFESPGGRSDGDEQVHDRANTHVAEFVGHPYHSSRSVPRRSSETRGIYISVGLSE